MKRFVIVRLRSERYISTANEYLFIVAALPPQYRSRGICYTLNLSFDRVLSAFELLSSDELEGIDSFDVIFDWFVIAPKVKNLSARVDVVNEIFDKLINFDKNASDTEAETISFDQDAPYIYAAFRQAYGIDLLTEQGKLQWWEFVSLLGALPSDTRMCDIIDIRTRPVPVPNGKNQEQISALLKLKAQYAIKKSRKQTIGSGRLGTVMGYSRKTGRREVSLCRKATEE